MRSASRRRGTLRGDQVVDARAKVLQHEILLGRRLAVVDLLGPLLQRQLDAERLVDREGDVEEVERIDPEVVDRVALRRDLVALDVARLGNNVRHGVERRRHRQPSENPIVFGNRAGTRESPRTRLIVRGRYSQGAATVQWRGPAAIPHYRQTAAGKSGHFAPIGPPGPAEK